MFSGKSRLFVVLVIHLIIKITISSIVIGLKNSCFPLIYLPVCYWTVEELPDSLLLDSLFSDSSITQSHSKL